MAERAYRSDKTSFNSFSKDAHNVILQFFMYNAVLKTKKSSSFLKYRMQQALHLDNI